MKNQRKIDRYCMCKIKTLAWLAILLIPLYSSCPSDAAEYKLKVGDCLTYKQTNYDLEEDKQIQTSQQDILIYVLAADRGKYTICCKVNNYIDKERNKDSQDTGSTENKILNFATLTATGEVQDMRICNLDNNNSVLHYAHCNPFGILRFPKKNLVVGDTWLDNELEHMIESLTEYQGRKCLLITSETDPAEKAGQRESLEKMKAEREKAEKNQDKDRVKTLDGDIAFMKELVEWCQTQKAYFAIDDGLLITLVQSERFMDSEGKIIKCVTQHSLDNMRTITPEKIKTLLAKQKQAILPEEYNLKVYLSRLREKKGFFERYGAFSGLTSLYAENKEVLNDEEYRSILIGLLKDDDPAMRLHIALRMLTQAKRYKRDMKVVLSTLKDPNPVVRGIIKHTLNLKIEKLYAKHYLDKKTYISILKDWLEDESRELRKSSVTRLLDMSRDDKELLDILVPLVDHPDSVMVHDMTKYLIARFAIPVNNFPSSDIKKWWKENRAKILRNRKKKSPNHRIQRTRNRTRR